jgi:hypothetical protein
MRQHLTYLGLIALLILVCIFFASQWIHSAGVIGEQKSIIAEKTAQIEYHVNEKGKIIAEKVAAEASLKELSKAYPDLARELKDDFDVKMKQMKAYIRNEFEARGSGMSNITNNYYDTITKKNVQRLEFNDGYLDFSALIDSTNHALSTYVYSDTVRTVIHTKKKWFMGSEKLYASSSLSNPSARVNGTTNLLLKNRDKRWVVSAGVSWAPVSAEGWNARQFVPTVTFGYALIKF